MPKGQIKANVLALKKYWQIFYSVMLILLIPLLIGLNTFWLVRTFKDDINIALLRHSLSLAETFNGAFQDELTDDAALQAGLERIASLNEDIVFADILTQDEQGFRVVASLTESNVGKYSPDVNNAIAWQSGQGIAMRTNVAVLTADDPFATRRFENLQEQYWSVARPLVDEEGKKRAILSLKLSSAIVDEQVQQSVLRSSVILAITLIVVILVLVANTRLFQYAVLAKKLKEVEQLKDEFISMASHELRTPITSLRGYLSMLNEGALGELTDLAKQKVRMMMSSADRLNDLVEDLLNVSRIEQGRLSINFEIITVEQVVEEVMAELSVQAEEKNLTFTYEKPKEPLPKLLLDPQRLKQILINIIGNSIKYTPKGSVVITTTYKEDDNSVEIKCADTGLGMTQKQRERLFTKFYRVKTAETESIKGTGLGLWITKQLIEMMDGEILVDSIKDVGTQMYINFPVKNEKAMALALSKQESEVKEEAQKVREETDAKQQKKKEEQG